MTELTRAKDAKRKATEEPASPVATKRIKHNDSVEPEKKPVMKPIPFPEKVCLMI
jgi:histone acetyltransferase